MFQRLLAYCQVITHGLKAQRGHNSVTSIDGELTSVQVGGSISCNCVHVHFFFQLLKSRKCTVINFQIHQNTPKLSKRLMLIVSPFTSLC